jgi:flagellar M-ring protein FliF
MAEQNLLTQGKNFFNRLNVWQKALFIGVPSVILLGLVLILSTGSNSSNYQVLFNDLTSADAGKITQSLKEKQIDYKLEDGGSTILVDKNNLYNTRIDLAAEGLPESSIVGYELFDKNNLGMSEFVQQVNFRRALEGEIARTIMSMDEVKKVRVHLVIPETKLFEKDQKEPTASVTLHLKSGRSLSRMNVEGIQTLVASSVEGLISDNVTVVNHMGRLLSKPAIDENSVAGKTAQQLEQQKRVESNLANKIKSMLDGVIGVNNSTVEVTADLNFTRIEQTKTDYDPERQVIRSEQAIQEVSESQDSLSYPAVNMAKDKSNIIQNYEIAKNVEHIIHSVGTVDRISVAVMINGTTQIIEEEGAKKVEYIPRTEEEMQKMEEIVKNAVGYNPGRGDQVSVINVPFDTMIDYDIVEEQNLQWWQKPDYQKLMALLFLMLLTIFVMFRLLQAKAIKDRMRIAMNLPAQIEMDDKAIEDEMDEEEEEELEDLNLDEDDLLLLPSELPEQLLLEGDTMEPTFIDDFEEEYDEDEGSLRDEALARLNSDDERQVTEDSLMKQEMKEKVEEFVNEQTEEAVKLVRIIMAQDFDLRNIK